MRNKIIITIILSLFFASCTNLEDEIYDGLPEDQFPENEAQIAALPIPTYQALQPLLDWGGWWFAQELTTDEVVCPTRGEHWDDGGKWRVLHTHEWTNNTEAVNTMWSHFYDGTFEANSALDLLKTFDETDEIKTTKAKLRAMRALYYWFLIDNYGDVPFTMTQIDVPLKPEKTPREEIWQTIVDDLEDAVHDIPQGGMTTAVSKGMAYTLLAKLYLNAEVYTGTAHWDKAEAYCDSVIALGYSLESDPLAPFVTENGASAENIFTIPYDEDEYTGFNLHMRTLHYQHNETFNMTVGPWNGFATVEDHYETYDHDNDLRQGYFLVGQQYDAAGEPLDDAATGSPLILTPEIPELNMQSQSDEEKLMSGVRVQKFEIAMGAKENLSNDYPIFRYADVLLMKAECVIRQGGNGDEWVNMIRERAGLEPWSGVSLDELLEERGRELFWEAQRRQDLIRFGKYGEEWWEKPASGQERETFPIPQWAIDANENLAK